MSMGVTIQGVSFGSEASAAAGQTFTGVTQWGNLDPSNRTPRQSDNYLSSYAPGPDAGTIELRKRTGVFDDSNGGRNAVFREGWNVDSAAAAAINPAWGVSSWGIESSFYQDGGLNGEIHNATYLMPGGSTELRVFTSACNFTTGHHGPVMGGSGGNIRYRDAGGGGDIDLISWDGTPSMNVAGNGFYYGTNGQAYNRQYNSETACFTSLPFLVGSEVSMGNDPCNGDRVPVIKVQRGIRFVGIAPADVPTPAAGSVTMFFSSATSLLSFKDSSGTVAPV